jgi:alanyl-tRNA synthetase
MTKEEMQQANHFVNETIRQNLTVYDEEIPYKQAIEEGATVLFDEKYGDKVRVMKIGEPFISAELCGGTHLTSTGEVGFFHIISESSIGAGLRRIEAVTGRGAEEYTRQRLSDLEKIAEYLETRPDDVMDKAQSLSIELKNERRQRQALERELAKKEAESLLGRVEVVNGINVLSIKVSSSNMQIMREMADFIRDRLKSVIIILGAIKEDGVVFVASVTSDLQEKGYSAKDIINNISKVIRGGGGGRMDFAQAGGKDKGKLDEALKEVEKYIEELGSS